MRVTVTSRRVSFKIQLSFFIYILPFKEEEKKVEMNGCLVAVVRA